MITHNIHDLHRNEMRKVKKLKENIGEIRRFEGKLIGEYGARLTAIMYDGTKQSFEISCGKLGAYDKEVHNDPTADFSLNSDAAGAATDNFHDTLPTSTLFYLSNGGEVNESSRTYVAYFFADKKGFSRVGRYQGNGNADGTFVYTGFRPGLLMLKRDGVQQWQLYNSAMGVNGSIVNFYPDSNEVATPTSGSMDLLSNSFKCRTSSAAVNSDSAFYYIAISEWPFVSSNDVPGVAR